MNERTKEVEKVSKCDKGIHVDLIRFDTMAPVLNPTTSSQTLNNGFRVEKTNC